MKKNILFVGEHPLLQKGNSHMLRALLERLDYGQFEPTCFVSGQAETLKQGPYHIIPAVDSTGDYWGEKKLLSLLEKFDLDILFMVGVDIWRYGDIFEQIKKIQTRKQFKWVALFPYDSQFIRKDWVKWINMVDVPLVYSEYGYRMLEDHVPNIQYFRPPMDSAYIYEQYPLEKRQATRKRYFSTIKDTQFIFGFIGCNQLRKDIQTLVKAFRHVKSRYPECVLYLHSDMVGECNLIEYTERWGFKTGDILTNPGTYSEGMMVDLYNCLDCYVNCSFQEGLSWTVLNALACGVPTIASDTTAHPELVKNVGLLVPCEEDRYLPLKTSRGSSWLDAKGCHHEAIAAAMELMITKRQVRDAARDRGPVKAEEWFDNVSDVNSLLSEASKPLPLPKRIQKVLFAQHSSAGDVLMTTRCLKGIKEMYPGMPLVYMTSPQYMNIVEDNPFIDEVIPWDESLLQDKYQFTVNPHGDRIAPGHWGRNSNSILSDFYWKILNVEPDVFHIKLKKPDIFSSSLISCHAADDFVVVHTTGGDPHFRTYKYMEDVCRGLHDMGLSTVQLGGQSDYPAGADIDLRGNFTFQETAWAMNQASLAITVDSFISHLAGALGISQVCLFGSGNVNVVRPNQMKGELICLSPDYVSICRGLGPCSGSVRDCPAPCTGSHDPKAILKAVKGIQSNGNIRRNFNHAQTLYSIKHAK